jgi:hypothetical protein
MAAPTIPAAFAAKLVALKDKLVLVTGWYHVPAQSVSLDLIACSP